MRGYFGIGVEGASKAMNVGSLFRTAHAFGASFVFTIGAAYPRRDGALADTSDTPADVPLYEFPHIESFRLPEGCRLVGVEISDQAVELPVFRHPRAAAYVLGSERYGLSPELEAACDHVVKIPTRFGINLAIAGALAMYDRTLSRGPFGRRPVAAGGPAEPIPAHRFGDPVIKRRRGPVPEGVSGSRRRAGRR